MTLETAIRDRTDEDWLRALADLQLAPGEFTHERHLQAAFCCLRASASLEEATDRMRVLLGRLAAAAGKPEKYHDTLTVFWMRAIAAASGVTPEAATWNELRERHPHLLDVKLPLTCYSEARLFSEEARTAWRAPDLADGGRR